MDSHNPDGQRSMNVTDFKLRGKPVVEWFPEFAEGLQGIIDAAPTDDSLREWLDRIYLGQLTFFDDLDEATFEHVRSNDNLSRYVSPYMTFYSLTDFLGAVAWDVPRQVPVPTRWEAKAVLARNYHGTDHGDDEILLQVRLPNHAISQEPYDFLNPQMVEAFDPEFIDCYQRPWTDLARDPETDTGCEVGIRLVGSTDDFTPLSGQTSHHRHMFQTGIDTWSFPEGSTPVEVAMRIRNYAVDQTGLKRDGEWSDPKSVTHAYSDKFRAWTGKLRSEMTDGDMVMIGRTLRYPCTPPTMQPDIPLGKNSPAPMQVSAGTRAYVERNAKRYRKGSTGKYWAELADVLQV